MHMNKISRDYTPVPFRLIKDIGGKELKVKDLVVYYFATSNNSEFAVSLRSLSDETGLSRVFVRESLDRLKSSGYLTWSITNRPERIKVNNEFRWVNVERRCFSRCLKFRKGGVQHRKVQNSWKDLICEPVDLTEIIGYEPKYGIGATELALLIYFRIVRFESDLSEKMETNTLLNITDIGSALGMSRSTVRKSIEVLSNLRLIRVDPDTQVVQIRDSQISYITGKRSEVKARQKIEEKRRNLDEFSFVDQMILRQKIETAGSKAYLGSVRGYLADLIGNGFIDKHRLASFVELCEASEERLKTHPELCDHEQVFYPETIFPIWVGGSNG